MIRMRERYATRLNGQTVIVRTIEIEQRLGKRRGKWVCLNEATGRKLWRTERQLHRTRELEQEDLERLNAGTGFVTPQIDA